VVNSYEVWGLKSQEYFSVFWILDPWRWDQKVRDYTARCVITQKSANLISFAAEVWNLVFCWNSSRLQWVLHVPPIAFSLISSPQIIELLIKQRYSHPHHFTSLKYKYCPQQGNDFANTCDPVSMHVNWQRSITTSSVQCLWRTYSFVNRTLKLWNQLPAEAQATFPCKSHIFRKRVRKVFIEEKWRIFEASWRNVQWCW
jgi:hypothetical protein